MIPVRARFAKIGKVRFTSHRDVARMWERALRRSGLPVAWSEGFSPRPLLSFGLALPTGCESLAEYLDIRLEHLPWEGGGPAPAASLALTAAQLTSFLPDGVTVQGLGVLPGDAASLQQEVTSCTWELEVLGVSEQELAERVERLLDAPSVLVRRERKGRQVEDDLRPSVRSLVPVPSVGTQPAGISSHRLRAELATQPRGVRPMELLEGLGAGLVLARARRTHQWIERDDARWEPLHCGALPGVAVPHAQGRAS